MVMKQWTKKLTAILMKYRYALLVLVIGLVLMGIPTVRSEDPIRDIAAPDNNTSTVQSLEDKLSILLSKVEGAGDVNVILTVAAGEEIIYQTNEDRSDSDTTSSINKNTVTVTDSGRNQTGLVRQVKPEIYQGAIILCHGADSPSVRLAIVDAVSRVTGLGADRISVLKMK